MLKKSTFGSLVIIKLLSAPCSIDHNDEKEYTTKELLTSFYVYAQVLKDIVAGSFLRL